MAEYFAEHGWPDITIAFPVNIHEIENLRQLSRKITLHLLVESRSTVRFLHRHLDAATRIWIKIDTGYHRTGIYWDHFSEIREIADVIQNSKNLLLEGLLIHAGHSYRARGIRQLREIYRDTSVKLRTVRDHLREAGTSPIRISYGDTPTCSVISNFREVDEIRPGNFVFYDLMQVHIGSCNASQLAAALVCPVVARHPERGELVIHGGAVHLSKEFIVDSDNQKNYGAVCEWTGSSWSAIIEGAYVSGLSQEHGIIKGDSAFIEKIQEGTLLAILPVHSCLTMNLMREFIVID
jgi:D-serine deaminase-like pyridoxal phosphate-dependent protein